MTLHSQPEPSSEPCWITIKDGSDREWRLISIYELKKLEYAINEGCVGKNDGCPPGHLKEMHDSGNETIDKVRSRPYIQSPRDQISGSCPQNKIWDHCPVIAQQSLRDQVLDEFKNWVIHEMVFCDNIGADHMFSHELILDKIEKFRTTTLAGDQ